MKNLLKKIIRQKYFDIDEDDLEATATEVMNKIDKGDYNFNNCIKSIFTQRGANGKKKRSIYSFKKNSIEYILCEYFKLKIDRAFHVTYANRQKSISLLFNTLPVIKDLNDFVVIRFDFQSFFDSVPSKFVFKKYILESTLPRKDKDLLENFCKIFSQCFAGLQTSNALTEIACKDFDQTYKAQLHNYGVIYYERYVDDVLIILNKYISKSNALRLINNCIGIVFPPDSVKINPRKLNYITRRNMSDKNHFDFLGYLFNINKNLNDGNINFKFGITDAKLKKYTSKIRNTLVDFKKNKNIELLRHRIKMFSCRTVYSRISKDKCYEWHTRGLIVNYRELRFHLNALDKKTESFLKYIYINMFHSMGMDIPYFMPKIIDSEDSIYNLYSNLKRNRSVILDHEMGIKFIDLLKMIQKLDPSYQCFNKTYYQIAQDYLDKLK